MRYLGRPIDAIKLWSRYTDAQEGDPPFLPLCMCPNPDHPANKPHFQINIEKPLVHCFSGCGISGSYEHAISIIEGCSRDEARKIILRNGRAPVGQRHKVSNSHGTKLGKRKKEALSGRELATVLRKSSYLPVQASGYLARRGISPSSIAKWKMGFDSDQERIIIPALDDKRIPRFLINRAISNKNYPKYLYSEGADLANFLFGVCFLDRSMVQSEGLIVVEGSLDVVRMHQHGLLNTVGILGSSISDKQAKLIENLRPRKVILLFDKDAAGINAVLKAPRTLVKAPIFIGCYPKGKSDPAELTKEEAHKVLNRARPFAIVKKRMKEVGIGT